MKKKFEMPVVSVCRFDSDEIVVASGTKSALQQEMESKGYNVTTYDLEGVF